MLSLNLAVTGPTSGVSNDGVIRGSVLQSNLTSFQTEVRAANTIYVLRHDVGAGNIFDDLSVQASAGTANGFLPWGTDATFSAGDELWIAADIDVCHVYVNITTSGVWTGDGLEVMESLDGKTLVPVGNLIDGSNGLRNAPGWYLIEFDENSATRKSIAHIFGATERKWVVLRPKGLTAKTTSPKLSLLHLTCHETSTTYADYTAVVNAPTAYGDFTGFPTNGFYETGVKTYYGLPGAGYRFDVWLYQSETEPATYKWEYFATDNTWKALPGAPSALVDDVLYNNPAVTYGDSVVLKSMSWTIPNDWTAKALTLTPATGAVTAHWLRVYPLTLAAYGFTPVAYHRRRVRSFGASNVDGFILNSEAITRLTIPRVGVPPLTEAVVQIVNGTTGKGASISIPAGSTGPLTSSVNLEFAAGDEALIVTSGGMAQDVEFLAMGV